MTIPGHGGVLTRALGIQGRSVVAVIGCGGKTSLIRLLAAENRGRAVLISPTTQMYPMEGAVGVYREETGKLTALPGDVLKAAAPWYDLVLLEADGSRGLPCKGWRDDEPAVPPCATHTVGVVTLRALGRAADERTCLRLPLFLRLTGLQAGDRITLQSLTDMVCAPKGMFQHSAGKRFLLVNQVEDEESASASAKWLSGLRADHPGWFDGLLYGSARGGHWQIV